MSWSTLSPETRELIERVCTPKEVEALRLKAAGYGTRRMAIALGISRAAVRERLASAARKVAQASE